MVTDRIWRATAMLILLGGGLPALVCGAPPAGETRPSREGVEFFEKKIRPILVRHCYECHSGETDKAKGKLVLDTHEGLRKGGQSGAVVVPGNAEQSLLIEAIRHEGLEMPPKQKLPDEVIADFVQWVEMGVPDPRIGKAARPRNKIDIEEARKFWSFRKPHESAPPAVADAAWPRTDIDRFILARLEKENLKPVADADRATLLRRVTFDLTGLPPTPEEIEAFLGDTSESAFSNVVDRLLASPQFGERWGRHWLDVARYGESTGKERNVPFRFAWRYRDYVIDSFNEDKPYDQFILEQIAGDLLPAKNDAERNTHLVATGFLAIGPKGIGAQEEQFRMDVIDDQIDAATRGFLGLTVACARCHDHKFDPIPTTDYYALAGIFRSTETYSGVGAGKRNAGDRFLLALADSTHSRLTVEDEKRAREARQKEIAETETELAELKKRLKQNRRQAKQQAEQPKPAKESAAAPQASGTEAGSGAIGEENGDRRAAAEAAAKGGNPEKAKQKNKNKKPNPKKTELAKPAKSKQDNRLKKRVQRLENELAELKNAPLGDLAMGVRDAEEPANCHVLVRGEVKEPGPEVPRGGLTVLKDVHLAHVNPRHSGRQEFARWIASSENPLTARVMVNRVWQHLFGNGLVETVDNFGTLGEEPSHPELLDTLAVRFMHDHWSVKRLIRSIVLSRVYQLGSQHDPAAFAADPGNRLLWRMDRRRLEAEEIRDALLAMGGNLDRSRPAGSPVMQLGNEELGRGKNAARLPPPAPVRSVYLPLVRNMVPEVLSVFDMADPSLITGKREVTNVATQSLFLLNNPLVLEQADRMARRLMAEVPAGDAARVRRACLVALGRTPTESEASRFAEYLSEYRHRLADGGYAGDAEAAAWSSLCQTLFASAEFRYLY